MKILIIHGPNLNVLGNRNSVFYGKLTLAEINKLLEDKARDLNISLIFFQSNHEGFLIDFIQKVSSNIKGIIINPGALTHYGYSLRDTLIDTKLPIIEVHLSDINKRDDFRKIDVLDGIVVDKIVGLKENSYLIGLERLIKHIESK